MTNATALAQQIVVGIGDCRVSSDTGATLITYALGSCIAVTAWDPVNNVGGMLHFLLPESSLDTHRGRSNPAMYADTGIPFLFERCVQAGAARKRLVVHAAGGAQVLNNSDIFNIGNRNHLSMRKVLWKAGVLVKAEATGGTLSRSVTLELRSGKVLIREGVAPWTELVQKKQSARLG